MIDIHLYTNNFDRFKEKYTSFGTMLVDFNLFDSY